MLFCSAGDISLQSFSAAIVSCQLLFSYSADALQLGIALKLPSYNCNSFNYI